MTIVFWKWMLWCIDVRWSWDNSGFTYKLKDKWLTNMLPVPFPHCVWCQSSGFPLCGNKERRAWFESNQQQVWYHSCRCVLSLSPKKGVWGCNVVQRAAACQISLIDLSAGSHQGDCALAVPVGCSVVQRSSERQNRGKRHQCPSRVKMNLNRCLV